MRLDNYTCLHACASHMADLNATSTGSHNQLMEQANDGLKNHTDEELGKAELELFYLSLAEGEEVLKEIAMGDRGMSKVTDATNEVLNSLFQGSE